MSATPAHRGPARVLMITPDHLLIDRRILQEAQTLRQAGYEVEILAGFECLEPSAYEWEGVRIERFKFDWTDSRVDWIVPLLLWAPGRLRTLLRRIGRRVAGLFTGRSSFERYVLGQIAARRYDILHCHDFPLLAAAVEAKNRRPTPLVYDAHELYHAQTVLPARTRRRYRRRERHLIQHVDLVITVNSFIARIMADDYGCVMPQVIFNAAPKDTGAVGRTGLRERLHLDQRDRIILYQGWMSRERGIERLVRAARFFPSHVHLVLIGYGDYEQVLRDISTKQGTDDGRVIFVGRVEGNDLAPLTRSADIGAIPYHDVDLNNYYSSPNKLFEYAAAGLPFVSNDLPFMRWIITHYGFGETIDLTKPESAAAAILSILNDPARLRALKNAAENAGAELNWENESKKFLALYDRIIPTSLDSARAHMSAGETAAADVAASE
jgi:glycosyltransferase involved in cell wall biosynthesis